MGKVLSISLGSEVVKVCEIALAGKRKIQVYNAIDLIIPEGLCDDGVILDTEALASAIKQGLQGEGFSSKKIIFTVTSKRIANKEAVIPYVKEKRIKDIVQINASEYFPITNLDDYSFNYSIIETIQTDNVKNYRLSVTATPNEIIEQYYALAKAMGMSVETIDYSGNSILQLLKLQTAGEGVDAVLQIGAENTVVNIMNGSTMVMQRSVPYGRLALVDAVKNSMGISDEEADMVLIEEDLGNLTNQYPDVADTVRAMFSSIGRILEFYRARNAEHPVERVFMIGDVTSVNGLPELINHEVDYEVEVVDALRGVEIKNHKVLSDEIVANYLANIGAVIDPMNIAAVTTGEKGQPAVKTEKLPWWILIFAAVVAVAMCGGILFIYFTKFAENQAIKAQIEALGDVESVQREYELAQSDLTAMQTWYDSTKGANETLVKLFDKLEEVQPSAVSITRFTSSSGDVTLEGQSYGKPAVAEFIMQLKALPYISELKTEYVDESIENASALDKFVMNFKLEYDDPEGGSEETATDNDSAQEESADEHTSQTVDTQEEPEEDTVPVVFEDDREQPDSETSDESDTEPSENVEGGVE